MEQVRADTAKNKISQEATAVSSAIISATQDETQVLVFVNQETSSERTQGRAGGRQPVGGRPRA